MSHLTDLQCSMAADDALSESDAQAVREHLISCAECQARIDAFIAERQMINAALNVGDEAVVPATMPKFTKPITLRGLAMVNVVTGLAVWLGQFLWKTLFGELIVNAFTQVTAIYIPDAYELMVSTALYFLEEGTTMIDSYLGLIVLMLLALTIAWFAYSVRKTRVMVGVSLLLMVTISVLAPPEASALEFHHDESTITIAASETVDDTLIAAGDTIIVDGNVNGDLVAMARRIVVNGSVGGNLLAFGETVTIEGEVGGLTLSAGSTVELIAATVGGDLWGAGGNVKIDRDTRVGRNAVLATEIARINGEVNRDLFAFSETIEVSGKVGEDLEAFSNRVNLLGDASVGGNLRFRGQHEDRLTRSPESTVGGEVEFLALPQEFEPRSRYLSGEFYVWQIVRLVSAFIAGMVLLWFVPDLRYVTLGGGIEGVKTAGIGLVAMISLPIIMVLFAITIVGLPLTMIGLFAWLLALYFAKIVVASLVGQMILASTDKADSIWLTLLAGLAVVIVAVNIPAIGGVISFILTIIGIGLLVQLTLDYVASLDTAESAE